MFTEERAYLWLDVGHLFPQENANRSGWWGLCAGRSHGTQVETRTAKSPEARVSPAVSVDCSESTESKKK